MSVGSEHTNVCLHCGRGPERIPLPEREAFEDWVRKNGGGLRSMEAGSVMWNRAREAFRAGWDARRESDVSGRAE